MVEKLLASSSNEHPIFTADRSSGSTLSYGCDDVHAKVDSLSFQTVASDCHLCVTDRTGKKQEFYVEKQKLMDSSQLFQCLFSQKCSIASNGAINGLEKKHTSSCLSSRLTQLRIQVPSVDTFGGILQWIYTRNDQQWLTQINEENFDETLANVVFLHLGPEAYNICTRVFMA
ncbi:hypothetical protein K493DRAFT_320850 [Basidiobolus meristosporus CBS 931.73]|uniref:BTB domain-containing protein n=1 Tax=Basidiobolus meristosporus CBS 931.73 TaxID=1314790 RepID=A0A1Y1X4R6_9FUNG|nr:hypothetical protein K493DRAFT_320850 [Basidiobolus meristosporus CBS 931.73]|eukprot:ORX80638.1 hypothetical protein K493DRAFT_320850 [Basidiobolus meristosporus CBS 931.73]